MDCMEFMEDRPDNYYDLAIVDPPYGIGASEKNSANRKQSRKSATISNNYGTQGWDSNTPTHKYFDELIRCSREQIIWGVNYYDYPLLGGRIYWDKQVTMPTYSDGELAYCSKTNSLKSFSFAWHGMIQGNMKEKEIRIHPTQKPVQLYRWLLAHYASCNACNNTGRFEFAGATLDCTACCRGCRDDNFRILDTHGGSFSSAIACHMEGFDLDICELDEDYFNDAVKRFKQNTIQVALNL